MTQPTREIEVEVLEIDGIAPLVTPPRPAAAAPPQTPWGEWQRWPGRVRHLDRRWWPLWGILAVLGLSVLLTFGLLLGMLVVVWRILRMVIRAVMRPWQPVGNELR